MSDNIDAGQQATLEKEPASESDLEIEREARTLGWVPKEEFRGSPDAWIDAKTFVERGRQLLPILQANNRRLMETVSGLEARVAELTSSLKAADAAVKALEEGRAADIKARVEDDISKIRARIAAAAQEGNHEEMAALTEQLVELKAALKAAEKPAKEEQQDKPSIQFHPEVLDWFSNQRDFVNDSRRIALANVVAAELRAAGNREVGKPFLDKVMAEVNKILGNGSSRTATKVEGSSGSRSSSVAGNSYADLPADAKAACDRLASKVVGPNRAYKDISEWRRAYAKQYFGS